ncbi:hypothetical protein OIDMADRAFT_168052 [Oidiodendron maius Zn]|uniref:Uncharacterized protein n=1 Tax=Oidiodendron maius (strain Zn) TaxID=913774 RepID=A0A0C3D7E8_OIDMZ|nr:hypothetical protein OIDMADRAFT_168052 [Oidiodendron maius Zn]
MKEVGVEVPSHPILAMQGAFAESMMEVADNSALRGPIGDAATRRRNLIDQPVTQETHAARWKQKPGQQYHQLWKLMAQISFGIYLLLNGIAKDDEQVMSILQGHVDEVDEFLETTLDDFDVAQQDIEERLKLLKLPLKRIEVFDAMLQDRAFRLQIVSGNEKIEHVITRTATAMNDALKDVKQGVSACKEFSKYLQEEQDEIWREERPEMEKVFDAMQGNVDGWYKAYISLQTKGNHLGVALVQLGSIVAEIDRRAGEISRKTRFSTTPQTSPTSPSSTPSRRLSQQMRQSMLKTLPSDPSMITPAISATLPAFQLVEHREQTPEPSAAKSDVTESSRLSIRLGHSSPEVVEPQNDDGYWGPRKPAFSVSEAERLRANSNGTNNERGIAPIAVPTPQELEAISSPPSQGIDSAYCSDPEKTFSPPLGMHPALVSSPAPNSPYIHPSARLVTPPMLRDGANTPRSDQQQYFLPVNASPHSPLQRPWTAAPASHHAHHNSNLSNLTLRNMPSAMGMSTMTYMTEGGTKKKKKSPFGWLKKAFSLSEEEKAAFEEKRRRANDERYYDERPAPKWIDGKRVR